jgi:DNA-binding response OmpR family regulator
VNNHSKADGANRLLNQERAENFEGVPMRGMTMAKPTQASIGTKRLLLVEDDPVLGKGLQVMLELEGYSVQWAHGFREAESWTQTETPDVVLLDLHLPDGDGLDYLKVLRQDGNATPVVILTARTDEDTVVEALHQGANDYIRKPFGNKELLARLETSMRGPAVPVDKMTFDRLMLSTSRRQAFYDGQEVILKRREFDLLLHLMEHAEAVVTRESVLDRFGADGDIFDRTVDSHVSHLRSRLRQAGVQSIRISPVYGIGYRLEHA